LRHTQAFYEVAQAGSFTIAAQEMNLTQSAVSMLVRQLELELDLKLFDRVNRAAKLTEVGANLLPTTERVLSDMRNVVDGAADLKALNRGTLRVSVPQMLACSWFPRFLADYRARYPSIDVSLADMTGDGVVASVADNLSEIGIGPERLVPSGVVARGLWIEQMQIVLPRTSPLAQSGEGLTLDQIQREPWIHYSEEFSLHLKQTVGEGASFGQVAEVRVNCLTTALAMVKAGHGLTAAPRYANVFEDQFDVVFRPLLGKDTGRLFCLYQRAGSSLSPAAASFVDLIEQEIAPQN
jgi:DNA-binding transcriptional LysR family regulator